MTVFVTKCYFCVSKGVTVRNYSHQTCFAFPWNTVLEILRHMITSTWPAQNTAQQWLHQQVIPQMDQNYDQPASWSLVLTSSHSCHCTQICLDSIAWASQVSGNSVTPSGSQHSRTPKTIHRFNENINRATNTQRHTALNSYISLYLAQPKCTHSGWSEFKALTGDEFHHGSIGHNIFFKLSEFCPSILEPTITF
jgi:hypothetical protein